MFIAVFIDLKEHRIPNIIVVFLLVFQIGTDISSFLTTGSGPDLYDLAVRYLSIFLITIFLSLFFSIGAIGAGDLKLIAVTALGFSNPEIFMAVTFAIAAVLSLLQMIRNHNFGARIKYLISYLNNASATGDMRYLPEKTDVKERKKWSVHLSVPVLITAVIFRLYTVLTVQKGCLW